MKWAAYASNSATSDSTSRGAKLHAGIGQVAVTIVVGMVSFLIPGRSGVRVGYHAPYYGQVKSAFSRPCVVILENELIAAEYAYDGRLERRCGRPIGGGARYMPALPER